MAAPARAIGAAYEPKRFGAYWLLDPIADSRFGLVHRACLRRGRLAEKLLAIKRVSPELSVDLLFAECFLDVMSGAARLRHPAHCAIEDVGRADGALYMAMEWVPGVDLARVVARLRQRELAMPVPLVLHVCSQVAAALAAAHRATRAGGPAPLFHAELAPSNILIGYDGRVKLTGIGSATLLAAAPQLAQRASYRSPELTRGAACSASSDLFSLGACLYELLAGEPYAGLADDGLARPGQPRPRSSIRRRIPAPLEQVVSRALAEQPAARWPNAAELGRALDRLAASHGPRANAAALGAFLLAHFDAERNAESTRLEALLAMIAPPTRSAGSSTRQRAVSSTPPPPPPAANREPALAAAFDPAERTPPRGNVMQELAAAMRAEPGSAQPGAPSQDQAAAPIAPPAADAGWDDDEPAPMWISSSEERATAGSLRTTGDSWSIPLRQEPERRAIVQRMPAPVAAPPAASYPAPPPSLALKLGVIASAALLVGLGVLALWPSSDSTRAPRAAVPAASHRGGAPKSAARVQSALPSPAPAAPASAPVERDADRLAQAQQPDEVRTARARRESSDPPAAGDTPKPLTTSLTVPAADDPLAGVQEEESSGDESSPSVFRLTPAPGAAQAAAAPAPAPNPPAAAAPAASTPARPTLPTPAAPASSSGPSREAILIEQVPPKFPSRALRMNIIDGHALVEYTVDRNGAVQAASVVASSPAGVFDEAALRAIQRWRYQPKLEAGKPVESRKRFRFTFMSR